VTIGIADLYWRAEDALPIGGWLNGLQCASTGLAVELRSQRRVAEACGPNEECMRLDRETPEDALLALTVHLRERDGNRSE
jgi:hypothetical protein